MLTNVLKLAFVISTFVGVVGCGDTTMTTGPDMAMSMSGSQDLAHAAAGPDLAMSSSGDGGLLALCATCMQNTECATGMCLPYMGGATKKCSHSCAAATASTDCPGINACNGMSVCKCQ